MAFASKSRQEDTALDAKTSWYPLKEDTELDIIMSKDFDNE